MRELYSSFMLIYVEEADDAVLERLGIDEPDETCIGFAEMMTIKLGELMDQPRTVRLRRHAVSPAGVTRNMSRVTPVMPA